MNAPNTNTRTGKVARLPYEIREQINEMIRDGAKVSELNAFLITRGHEPLNDTNFTNWKQGGYLEWLSDQDYLDTVRKKHETIRRELEAGGFSILDRAIFEIAAQLADSDLEPTKVASAISSLKFAVDGSRRTDIADRRAKLAEDALALERDKFKAAQARANQADKAEGVVKDKTLTPEEKDRKFKEIFGLA